MCLAGTQHHKEGLLTQSGPLLGDQRGENRRSRKSRRATVVLTGRRGGGAGIRSVSGGDLDALELRLMSHVNTFRNALVQSQPQQRVSKKQEIAVTNLAESPRKPSFVFFRSQTEGFSAFDTLAPSPRRKRECGDDNDVFGFESLLCGLVFPHSGVGGGGGGGSAFHTLE